jgi:predicted GH43/DUF377 family glycosyl hydrolase
MLYNGGRIVNFNSPRINYNLLYSTGYLILDETNPKKILKRSSEPILFPMKDYEKCIDLNPKKGLSPYKIITNGIKSTLNDNEYLIYYSSCDSEINIGNLKINFKIN